MKNHMISIFLFLTQLNFRSASHPNAPEQIHLAYGRTPDIMAIQWATVDEFCTTTTTVQYGLSIDSLSEIVFGECYKFELPAMFKQSNHLAYMTGLQASTKYFYRVGDADIDHGWSNIYHFNSAPDAITTMTPQKVLVFGDLSASSTGPTNSSTIMPYASREVADNHFDSIIHLGDLAYDFASKGGHVGRQFMNEIQNMSAYVPYMVCHGNHESAFRFAHFTEFFRNQPTNLVDPSVTCGTGEAPNNWYFSWNVGLVHYIVLSSEIYFNGYSDANTVTELPRKQFEWLQQDLIEANRNRSSAPWIIALAHRSIYCSCDDDCNGQATTLRAGILFPDGEYRYGLESLFFEQGVDLYLNGHEHNYERMFDVSPDEKYNWTSGITTQSTTNPPATIYIVTGDAGNHENHEVFSFPQPDRSAYRTDAFGYSRMTIYNSSHLFWEQVQCDNSVIPVLEGVVVDSVWIIQENHGPFTKNKNTT